MEIKMPSFIKNNDTVRAYKICNGDVIEYTLAEFLKPLNINMLMHNNFEVIGYGEKTDYWFIRLFGKYRRIYKPFVRIKTVRLMYKGE